ncbi:MAG: methyltransferase domain-containing protein [Acidimicrobiales bacterium]|nr:methyltransferase domain-containing protein [Hyphomonadaceae bacterium]RZV42085.1 MAG: methyltransferase domain-containing protein [Acidimicrobiales bacterium]
MRVLNQDVRFYKGAVRADQPANGYRAGNDALLLAASIRAKPGQKCLELGTGSGVVPLLVNHKWPDLELIGIEKNNEMVRLARENTKSHDNIAIVESDILELPKSWHLQYDQVFANPPFFDDFGAVRMSPAKAPSFVNDDVGLEDWIAVMLKMLKPRGIGTLIARADSLEKICHSLYGKAGRLRTLPIHSYADAPAKRVLVQFRKGVKSESTILPPLVMHDDGGNDRFSAQAEKILCGELPIDMNA